MAQQDTILEVNNLQTVFHALDGAWPAINGLNFSLRRGEVMGLVGESGSGKSVAGFSLMGLIDPSGEVVSGEILLNGRNLRNLSEKDMRKVRGTELAMIFQDPLTTLNPVLSIGEQMAEAITEHRELPSAEVEAICLRALERVGITAPAARLKQYPHELSGGMRQRIAIATALLNDPEVIIADEPTTALDVTIQGQIISEVQKLQKETGTAIIWITHDLGVVAELADRIAVMYAGDLVEIGTTDEVLDNPRHPYTRGLLQSVPGDSPRGQALPMIEGAAPPLSARPIGCAFHPRCARASEICCQKDPQTAIGPTGRSWRCHHPHLEEGAK